MPKKTRLFLVKTIEEANDVFAGQAVLFPGEEADGQVPLHTAWTDRRSALMMAGSINWLVWVRPDTRLEANLIVVEIEFEGDLRAALSESKLPCLEQPSSIGTGSVFLFLGEEVWNFLNERCRAVGRHP